MLTYVYHVKSKIINVAYIAISTLLKQHQLRKSLNSKNVFNNNNMWIYKAHNVNTEAESEAPNARTSTHKHETLKYWSHETSSTREQPQTSEWTSLKCAPPIQRPFRASCSFFGCYRQEARSANLPALFFTHMPIFWVFRPAGATRYTDQGEIWQGGADRRSSLSNFTLIGSGFVGLRPQNFKNWNFINIIAPKRRVPCTILTKFTSFMRVLSLNKSAKFGCFSSINDKIINNLPRWGRFPPNFRWP